MSNRRNDLKPDHSPSTSGQAGIPGRKKDRKKTGNLLVGLTIAGTVLAILIAVGPLTPILLSAPIVPLFFRSMKSGDRQAAFQLALRWALTVLITVTLIGGFISERTVRAVPFAGQTITTIQNWGTLSDAPPPADYFYMASVLLIFGTAVLLTGGAAGFLAGAIGLASSACGAAYLFQRGDNLFHVLIIAVPPWLLSLFAACLFLLVPAATIFYRRLSGGTGSTGSLNTRRHLYLGLGLALAGFLLRLATADIWLDLMQRWTTI